MVEVRFFSFKQPLNIVFLLKSAGYTCGRSFAGEVTRGSLKAVLNLPNAVVCFRILF